MNESTSEIIKLCVTPKSLSHNVAIFRNDLNQTLKDKYSFMIAYYSYVATVPSKFGGHFSPIIAYDSKTDKALIMDVAAHFGVWHWIQTEDLFKTMFEED